MNRLIKYYYISLLRQYWSVLIIFFLKKICFSLPLAGKAFLFCLVKKLAPVEKYPKKFCQKTKLSELVLYRIQTTDGV